MSSSATDDNISKDLKIILENKYNELIKALTENPEIQPTEIFNKEESEYTEIIKKKIAIQEKIIDGIQKKYKNEIFEKLIIIEDREKVDKFLSELYRKHKNILLSGLEKKYKNIGIVKSISQNEINEKILSSNNELIILLNLLKIRENIIVFNVLKKYKPVPDDKQVQDDKPVPDDKQVQDDKPVSDDKPVPDDKQVQDDKPAPRVKSAPPAPILLKKRAQQAQQVQPAHPVSLDQQSQYLQKDYYKRKYNRDQINNSDRKDISIFNLVAIPVINYKADGSDIDIDLIKIEENQEDLDYDFNTKFGLYRGIDDNTYVYNISDNTFKCKKMKYKSASSYFKQNASYYYDIDGVNKKITYYLKLRSNDRIYIQITIHIPFVILSSADMYVFLTNITNKVKEKFEGYDCDDNDSKIDSDVLKKLMARLNNIINVYVLKQDPFAIKIEVTK